MKTVLTLKGKAPFLRKSWLTQQFVLSEFSRGICGPGFMKYDFSRENDDPKYFWRAAGFSESLEYAVGYYFNNNIVIMINLLT